MKQFEIYKLINFLVLCFLLIGSCKKDEIIRKEPSLDGLWRLDTTSFWGSQGEMLINGDSVILYENWRYNPIEFMHETARGIIRILPDTSFFNSYDSVNYSGKHLKIDVVMNSTSGPGITYGVFELSKDSLIIHKYCCFMHLKFYRIR